MCDRKPIRLLLEIALAAVASMGAQGGEPVRIPFCFDPKPPNGFVEHVWRYGGTGTVEGIAYSVKRPFRRAMAIRVTDASGQTFQESIPQGSEVWYRHEKRLAGRWELHYGGAKDGVLHHPIKDFRVLVLGGGKEIRGEVYVKDVVFRERPEEPLPTLKMSADVYGPRPPDRLGISLTACDGAFADGRLEVSWQDWDGGRIDGKTVDFPSVPSGGVWKVDIPYPPPPPGRNAIFCSAVLRMARHSSVHEGPAWTAPLESSEKVVPDQSLPWGTGIYLHRWGGSEKAFAKMDALCAAASAAGVKWLREQIVWSEIVRSGSPVYAKYDRIMSIVERYGLSICMLFGALPKNATWNDPDYPERYCEALRLAVRRYKGRVAAWEIVNEPNLPWPMDSRWKANYRRLLPMATQVVHEEDPAARTVGCSASGLGVGFIRSLADETFDDVSIHPYRRFVDSREFLADLAEVYAAAHGRAIWITEIGWHSFPGYTGRKANSIVPLHEFASLMARAHMAAAAAPGVKAIFGYDFVDDGILAAGYEYHMGVIYDNGAPKPAYRALAKVFRHFSAGKPFLDIRPDGLRVFSMGGRCAVWSHGMERTRIAVEGTLPQAANLMDEPVLPQISGGKTTYCVDDGHPLFFDGEPGGIVRIAD